MDLKEKIEILAECAKYDASCSSSGSERKSKDYSIGNAAVSGICHSFTSDGRCISLLKILLTNYCIYDCQYCINRKSNDIKRAILTVDEICDITYNFYKRNYIEGLFLSSGIIKSPDFTMELIFRVVKKLREDYKFGGYIHSKAIGGADKRLINLTGLYVDRMSCNIELPNSDSYKLLAPDKNKKSIITSMNEIKCGIENFKENKSLVKKTSQYVPGGQSTQLIVGATMDSDYKIINLSQNLYDKLSLKRVYYSAYTPINTSSNLPNILYPPLLREHRLYQADWLLRFYKFKSNELLNEGQNFDEYIDPKSQWALNNLHLFPLEINRASYEMLLRIPGVGVKSALRIVKARKLSNLNYEDIKTMGIVLKRAKHFITINGKYYGNASMNKDRIYDFIKLGKEYRQLSFFDLEETKRNVSPLLDKLKIKGNNYNSYEQLQGEINKNILDKKIILEDMKYMIGGNL